MIGSQRVAADETVTIFFHAVDSSNGNITAASDFQVGIWRDSDDTWLDFSDHTFGGTITTRFVSVTEIDATNAPGVYKYTYDLSNVTNHSANADTWLIVTKETSGTDLGFTPVGELIVIPTTATNSPYEQAIISTLAVPTAAAVADAVWDEAIGGHAGAGSTGESLSNATAPSAAAVADAVWDEALSGHTTSGSAGLAFALIKALLTGNYTLDNVTYSANGLMTSGRVRLWNSAGNTPSSGGGSETTGRLGVVTLTATADTSYPSLPGFGKGTLSED